MLNNVFVRNRHISLTKTLKLLKKDDDGYLEDDTPFYKKEESNINR